MSGINIVSTDSDEAVTEALGLAKTDETATETKAKADEKSEVEAKPSDDESLETDSEAKEESDAKDDKDKEQKPKKKGGFQKKIGRISAERDFWKEQALAAQSAKKPSEDQTTTLRAETSNGKPTADQFDTHADYVAALAEWTVETRLAKEKEEQKKVEAKTQQQKALETYQAKLKDFTKEHTDFDDVIESVSDVPMSLAVQNAILKSDIGPELMYELAKDTDLFQKVNSLDYERATFEMGKLQAKLELRKSESDDKPKTLTKTKAPPPLSAIGSKSASVQKDPDKMDFQEFKKWREETLRNR